MNKHPMLSVKEAAKLMGCDERWVRERLNQGQLKGEKKKVGLKDKWYVYAGEVEEALEKLKGACRQPILIGLSCLSTVGASSARRIIS